MSERGGIRTAALRTALIGYGTLAISLLLTRSGLQQAAVPVGLVAAGVALQFVLVFAQLRVKGRAGQEARAGRLLGVLELIGDGITVLLFAIATLRAVTGAAASL